MQAAVLAAFAKDVRGSASGGLKCVPPAGSSRSHLAVDQLYLGCAIHTLGFRPAGEHLV
jgi:hypothetical protein